MLLNISHAYAEATDTTEILKEYDIEIIIFEDAHARYINSESWHKDSSNEDIRTNEKAKQIESKDKTISEGNYQTIDTVILKKEYKRINNSSEFNVMQYSAWRQAGLKSADAFEIDISQLNNTHKNQSENIISGKVKVVLARYLHFYSELEYERQNDNNDEIDASADVVSIIDTEAYRIDDNRNIELKPANDIYILQNHRRMRSKELHYIDHPLVGVLIQINPVELISDEATPNNQTN